MLLGHTFAYNELYIFLPFSRMEMLKAKEPSLLSCSLFFCLPQILLSSCDGLYDTFRCTRLLSQWHLHIPVISATAPKQEPHSVSLSEVLNISKWWQFSSFELSKFPWFYWFFSAAFNLHRLLSSALTLNSEPLSCFFCPTLHGVSPEYCPPLFPLLSYLFESSLAGSHTVLSCQPFLLRRLSFMEGMQSLKVYCYTCDFL